MMFLLLIFSLDWPRFGNTLQNTHYQYGKGAMIPSPVIKWTYSAGQIESLNPVLVDLDNDSLLEIVFGSWGSCNVYALHSNGTLFWQYPTGGGILCAAASQDINEDGDIETIIGNANFNIYALRNTGTLLWSYHTGGVVSSSPLLTNIDGDNALEIIVGNNDNKIYALDTDGTLLWSFLTNDRIYFSSAALGDINKNGNNEILIGSNDSKIYAIRQNGMLLWWYTTGGTIWSAAPSIANINSDSFLEVLCGSNDGKLYALDYDGKVLWSFVTSGCVSSTSIGDLDGDSIPDIVFGDYNGILYALNGAGALLWKQTVGGVIHYAPAMADLDGDNHPEILVPNNTSNVLYCYNHDGTLCWNITLGYDIHGIAIGDIDNDGCLEAVTGTASPGCIYVLDDSLNKSNCDISRVEEKKVVPDINMNVRGKEINFSIAKPGHASLVIYDITGRLKQTLFEGCLYEGNYSAQIKDVSPGIYFAKLISEKDSLTKKLILVK